MHGGLRENVVDEMKISIILVISLFVLLTLAPSVQASSIVVFNTTSAFDAGTKTNVDTITDSCFVPSDRFGLSVSGFVGISSSYITGACVDSTGLKLSYDMETITSGAMKDFSGNGNNGAIVSTNSVNGKVGMARDFLNSTTAKITAANNFAGSVFTISMWIYARQKDPTIDGNIFTIPSDSGDNFQMNFIENAGHKLWITYFKQGVGYIFLISTVWYDKINEWHHVLFYMNGSSAYAYYLDGNLIATGTPSQPPSSLNLKPKIGKDDLRSLNGNIDEVLLFNRVLSATEISSLASIRSYSTSGSWESQSQTYTGEFANELLVTYSNANANTYIDSLSILSSTNTLLYFNDTNVVSGIGTIYSIPSSVFLQTDWKVNLSLAGNGTQSILISSINISTVRADIPFSDFIVSIFFIILFIFLLVLGFGFKQPIVIIFGGLVGIFFGIWIFSNTGDGILGGIVIAVGAIFIVLGAVKVPD